VNLFATLMLVQLLPLLLPMLFTLTLSGPSAMLVVNIRCSGQQDSTATL
jgi:hypothetical protein